VHSHELSARLRMRNFAERRVALVYFSRKSSSALITRTFVACKRSIVNKRMMIIYAAMGNQCAYRAQIRTPNGFTLIALSRVTGEEDRYKLRCVARLGLACYTTCSLPIILPTYYSYQESNDARGLDVIASQKLKILSQFFVLYVVNIASSLIEWQIARETAHSHFDLRLLFCKNSFCFISILLCLFHYVRSSRCATLLLNI